MEWTQMNDMGWFYGKFKIISKKNNFACFDLDDTLIKTKSGKRFPIDESDWMYNFEYVPNVIRKLWKDGFRIIIITNQGGLKNRDMIEQWENKLDHIVSDLNIPIEVYAATKKNYFRKPIPGFWEIITNKTGMSRDSFYCGDACGRAGDFSDTDLKFAFNCGLLFRTPEMVFLNKNVDVPNISCPIKSKYLMHLQSNFNPKQKEIVLMIGFPGSGKSSFVEKYIEPCGYVVVNRDTCKTMPKCIRECKNGIANMKSIVVDNLNNTVSAREKFIQLALDSGYNCRCIIMDTPLDVAKHNAAYRNYVTKGAIEMVPDVVYATYKKRYVAPQISEGIDDIIRVDFSVEDGTDMKKYMMCFS